MNLNGWFEKGLTLQQYVDYMKANRDEMMGIYEKFEVTSDQQTTLSSLKELNLRVIVLTEDWCGDAMLNNPILLKIAEASNMEVRFILRDSNLELMDQYLTNGTSRSIPIFIFIDQDGNEFAVWGPRASEVQAFVSVEQAKLPEKEAPDYKERFMAMVKQFNEKYQNDVTLWNGVANSIIKKLVEL